MTKRLFPHLDIIGAGLLACALVLAGATDATASICLRVVAGDASEAPSSAHFGNAETPVPLGFDLLFDNGVALGLYAIDFPARSGMGDYVPIDTIRLTDNSLGLEFDRPLSGFGVLVLSGGSAKDAGIRITTTEVGGGVATSVFSVFSQGGGPSADAFLVVESPAGLEGVVIETLDIPPSHAPEPGTIIIWSLLGAFGIGVGWWRQRRKTA